MEQQIEQPDPIIEATAMMQQVYDAWGPRHEGKFIHLGPYDPNNPSQRVDAVVVEAQPNLEQAVEFGRTRMGAEAYDKLVQDLVDTQLAVKLFKRAEAGKSSMVVTFHLNNVFDTPLGHNGLFVAAVKGGASPDVAHKNALVSNGLMARMEIPDSAGNWHNAASAMANEGRVLLSTPREGAKFAGMDSELIGSLERGFTKAFTPTIENGSVVHWALSETRAKRFSLDGQEGRLIPAYDEALVRIILKRSPFIVPLPMNITDSDQGNSTALMSPIEVTAPEHVHQMATEAAKVLSDLSGMMVVYGELPEGAEALPAA